MIDIITYKYAQPMREGIFLSRPNRFIAEILINDKVETVHVKNTGRLPELLVPGIRCWVQEFDNPLRKTKFDLITVEYKDTLVNIDSQVPNKIIYEAFVNSKIEGWENPDKVEKEVKVGNSRIDFRVTKGEKILYVEVKGVNLVLEGGVASFPDAITTRGTKHVFELTELNKLGYRTMILFLAQREDLNIFRPHFEMDPIFSNAFYKAVESGVESRIYKSKIGEDFITLGDRVSIMGI